MSQFPWNNGRGDGDGNNHHLYKFLSDARHNSKFFTHMSYLIPITAIWGRYCDYSYLTEEEIEAQKICKRLDQDHRASKCWD